MKGTKKAKNVRAMTERSNQEAGEKQALNKMESFSSDNNVWHSSNGIIDLLQRRSQWETDEGYLSTTNLRASESNWHWAF